MSRSDVLAYISILYPQVSIIHVIYISFKLLVSRSDVLAYIDIHTGEYEGCSNMNASSFITFFTYMLRENAIPF